MFGRNDFVLDGTTGTQGVDAPSLDVRMSIQVAIDNTAYRGSEEGVTRQREYRCANVSQCTYAMLVSWLVCLAAKSIGSAHYGKTGVIRAWLWISNQVRALLVSLACSALGSIPLLKARRAISPCTM